MFSHHLISHLLSITTNHNKFNTIHGGIWACLAPMNLKKEKRKSHLGYNAERAEKHSGGAVSQLSPVWVPSACLPSLIPYQLAFQTHQQNHVGPSEGQSRGSQCLVQGSQRLLSLSLESGVSLSYPLICTPISTSGLHPLPLTYLTATSKDS